MRSDRLNPFVPAYFLAFVFAAVWMVSNLDAAPTPLRFQGRFVGLLCEQPQQGKLEIHDEIVDNNLTVDYRVNDESAPSQLASGHRWAGTSRNGILSNVSLGQPGQVNVNFSDGSVTFQASLSLNVNNKLFSLPFTISTTPPPLPAGLPPRIAARKLETTEKNKSGTIGLAGVSYLQGEVATAFRNLLKRAGIKVGNGQLLFATFFEGTITRRQ